MNEQKEVIPPAVNREPQVAPKKEAIKPPDWKLPAVPRNDVTDLPFKLNQIIRGKNEGKFYPAPDITPENWDKALKWLGLENVLDVVVVAVKRASQVIFLDCVESDGSINWDAFTIKMAEFSASSQKLSELKDKYDELVAKQNMMFQKINMDDIMSPDPAVVQALKNKLDEMKKLGAAISVTKERMDNKSRKNTEKPEEEAQPSVEVE